MTTPRNQYWRRIVPVVGEPIPDGAEWCVTGGMWVPNILPTFGEWSFTRLWRVPVPVVPLSVAVDAVMHNAFEVNGDNYWTVEIDGQCQYRADTEEKLRQLVTAKLIELAEQESE